MHFHKLWPQCYKAGAMGHSRLGATLHCVVLSYLAKANETLKFSASNQQASLTLIKLVRLTISKISCAFTS